MKKQIAAALAAMFVLSTAATVMAADVKFSGDGRIQMWSDPDNYVKNNTGEDFIAKTRYRLTLTSQLDKNVKITTRFKSGDIIVKNDYANAASNDTYMDQFYGTYKADGYTVNFGKQGTVLGQGVIMEATGDLDAINVEFGDTVKTRLYAGITKGNELIGGDMKYAPNKKSEISGVYIKYEDDDIWALGGKTKVADQLTLAGEYAQTDKDYANNQDQAFYVSAYNVTNDFPKMPLQKVGTTNCYLTYADLGTKASPAPLTMFGNKNGAKGFYVGYGKTFAKNTAFGIEYADLESKSSDADYQYVKGEFQIKF